MGELLCVDGTRLGVAAIPWHDRSGQPYDMVLRLSRSGQHFGTVGRRCSDQLGALARQVRGCLDDPVQAAAWPDAADRLPDPAPAAGASFRPGDQEYFALRATDPGDPSGTAELRCYLRSCAQWTGESWHLTRRAIVEAWGEHGCGVRAVLTSPELVNFLDTVLAEPAGAALPELHDQERAVPRATGRRPQLRGPGLQPGQRGRRLHGIAWSRLPALRAAARGVTLAVGGAQARRGDVRW